MSDSVGAERLAVVVESGGEDERRLRPAATFHVRRDVGGGARMLGSGQTKDGRWARANLMETTFAVTRGEQTKQNTGRERQRRRDKTGRVKCDCRVCRERGLEESEQVWNGRCARQAGGDSRR